MRELEGLLDSLDLSVALSADLVGRSAVQITAEWAADARRRLAFVGDTVVLGVAGGTGSGKSALVNALVGKEVAGTGPVRPTTSMPLVAMPANPEPGLVELLNSLGLGRRTEHDLDDRLVLIDLPDVDSDRTEHREMVSRIAKRLDGLLWVLDPEKYNDESIHIGLLDSMLRQQRHLLFVLNQADRVAPDELKDVVDDAWKRLLEDGFDDPQIFTTAAAPSAGAPLGIEELRETIDLLIARKGIVIDKIISEVGAAREALSLATGVRPGTSVGFDRSWAPIRIGLVDGLGSRLRLAEFEKAVGEVGAASAVGTLRGAISNWRSGGQPPSPSIELPGEGWAELALPVDRLIAELGERDESQGTVELDDFEGGWAQAQIEAIAADVVGDLAPPPIPDVPFWVLPLSYLKYGLGVVAVLAILITLVAPNTLQAGRWPVLILVAAAGLGGAMLADLAAQRSGRESGQWAAQHYVTDIKSRLDREVERSIASPLRQDLRSRAQLAGTLTELGLNSAALGERRRRLTAAESPPEEHPAGSSPSGA